MPIFQSSEELEKVAVALAEKVKRDATIAPTLVETGLCIRWKIKNPEVQFAIDFSKKPEAEDEFFTYYLGDPERSPDVVFTMKGDAFHKFWLGKLSLPIALATRAIVLVKGNPVKILKLLPKIKPVYPLYREVLTECGHADKIIT